MNTTLTTKIASIHRWGLVYLMIAAICFGLFTNPSWLKTFCITQFHQKTIIQEYAWRAMDNPENLPIISKILDAEKKLTKKRGWRFENKKIIIPSYDYLRLVNDRGNNREFDTLDVKTMDNPNFFKGRMLEIIGISYSQEAEKIYNSPLLKGKVDMKTFYQSGTQEYVDYWSYDDEDILQEYEIMHAMLIFLLGMSMLIWCSLLYSVRTYGKLIRREQGYNGDNSYGTGYGIFNGITFVGIALGLLLVSRYIGFNLYALLFSILLFGTFCFLFIMTDPFNLITVNSTEIDMAEAAPDLFKESEIRIFSWFVPLGADENEWKETMCKEILETRRNKRKELIERSKELGQ